MTLKQMQNETVERWNSDTPDYFKHLRKWAILVGIVVPAITGSILTAGVTLPLWITIVAGVLTSICAGIAGTAQLTKDN